MAARGSTLGTNEFLSVGDYLVSNNKLFFAVMQGDGNFVVYRGSPSDMHGALWSSAQAAGYAPAAGDYVVAMQQDGNFVGYRGKSPLNRVPADFMWGTVQLGGYAPVTANYRAIMQDDGNFCVYREGVATKIWCTMAIDPVTAIEITHIDYDVNSATVMQTSPANLYQQTVHNNSNVPQTSRIMGSSSVAEMRGWSNALQIKVGVSTTLQAGIPLVFEGKVTVSAEVNNTYTWNGSETITQSWGFDTAVTAPPHSAVAVLISVTLSTIAVPYTLGGIFILQSGARIPGQMTGVYTGTNSHDLQVTFATVGPGIKSVAPTTIAIEATAT